MIKVKKSVINMSSKNKKKLLIIMVISFIALAFIGYGIKKYMAYRAEEHRIAVKVHRREILESEREIVKDLSKYDDVREIKFYGYRYDGGSGAVYITFIINNNKKLGFAYDASSEGVRSVGIGDNNPDMKLNSGYSNIKKMKIQYSVKRWNGKAYVKE